jgi:hypothetical protein
MISTRGTVHEVYHGFDMRIIAMGNDGSSERQRWQTYLQGHLRTTDVGEVNKRIACPHSQDVTCNARISSRFRQFGLVSYVTKP